MPFLITYIIRALQFFVEWLYDSIFSSIPSLDDVISYFPDSSLLSGLGLFGTDLIDCLNFIFPVDYAAGCFVSWCIIAAVVYTINWVLGFIPTVS